MKEIYFKRCNFPWKYFDAVLNSLPRELEEWFSQFPKFYKERKGFVLSGPKGIGKTYLVVALMKEIVRNFFDLLELKKPKPFSTHARQIRYISAHELFLDYPWRVFSDNLIETDWALDADWLIIDDIDSSNMDEKLEKILRIRFTKNRMNILITSYQREEFKLNLPKTFSFLPEVCYAFIEIMGKIKREKL
jgi:DNA replication protein DnaC